MSLFFVQKYLEKRSSLEGKPTALSAELVFSSSRKIALVTKIRKLKKLKFHEYFFLVETMVLSDIYSSYKSA